MKNKRESLMRELDILTQPTSVDDDIKNNNAGSNIDIEQWNMILQRDREVLWK